MGSKATKRPWEVIQDASIFAGKIHVATCGRYNTEANAALIAAAPDLLECADLLALVTAEGKFQSEDERINMHKLARAALKRAGR